MTLERIRQKARELHAKTRRELLGNMALGLLVFAISGPGILRAHDPGPRWAFAFALAWALAGQLFLHRGMWSTTLPGDAALSTGFEFYRREIERRSNLFRRVLRWSLGPVVLSIGAWIVVMSGIAEKRGLSITVIVPFGTLFAIWIVAVFIRTSQGQRALRRELDELNQIDRANGR